MITDRQLTVTPFLAIASAYLYWSGESRKIQIRLCSMVARSGDIVLSAVYLSLRFVRQGGVNAPRQNNNMSGSRFASSCDSCAATDYNILKCLIWCVVRWSDLWSMNGSLMNISLIINVWNKSSMFQVWSLCNVYFRSAWCLCSKYQSFRQCFLRDGNLIKGA